MHVWLQGPFISAALQSQPGLQQTIWKKVLVWVFIIPSTLCVV